MAAMGRRQRGTVRPKFRLWVTPAAWAEIKALPGYLRHRVKRAVDALAEDPRPSRSISLEFPELEGDLRRLRIENWRIIYAVSDAGGTVDVLGVRKRPPYQYEDLKDLIVQPLP